MPYLVFALIFANGPWILDFLLSSPSRRDEFINGAIKGLGFLWFVAIFLILIMIRRLRDTSIEKFLDQDMPYPQKIKENMQKCLYTVFSPYKFKKEIPHWFKKQHPYLSHTFLLNHLYPALFLSIVAGTIAISLPFIDPRFGSFSIRSVIIAFTGFAVPWFFAVIMGHMMISITAILRKISKELEKSNETKSFASIVKIKELKILPLNILYAYTSVMITFPSIVWFQMFGKGPWMYFNIFMLIVELSFFLFVLAIPNYYVHLAVKRVKEQFYQRQFSLIEELENKIHNKSATEQDLKTYELSVNMLDKAERIYTWPFDIESVTKIVIMAIVGSIPAILQIFFIK